MKLLVSVASARYADSTATMEICCGEGKQTIKWLALAVTQRALHSRPNGTMGNQMHARRGHSQSARMASPRARSCDKTRGFFCVPADVLDEHGHCILPEKLICDVFEDGEQVQVRLAADMQDAYGRPTMPQLRVDRKGVPDVATTSTGVSKFVKQAFLSPRPGDADAAGGSGHGLPTPPGAIPEDADDPFDKANPLAIKHASADHHEDREQR
jgi:hypothetical protein